jgi:uncharacterized membrane protein (DUF4010 family)
MDLGLFEPLGIALILGLLVGIQREWSTDHRIAGIRTFPLITLFGTLSGILAGVFGGWVVGAGLLAVAGVLYIGNMAKLRLEKAGPGMTTEMAALVMFGIGALLSAGYTAPAVALGGVVAVLLHWKTPLHAFVQKIGENDLKAIFQLVLIGLVILPLLPDRTFGWFDVLNPYKIWLMVVLIAGINVTAYLAYRLFGTRGGTVLGGLLGGLISSTATTVSYARQSRQYGEVVPMAVMVILLATLMMNVRVLIEIGVVAPGFLPSAAPPLGLVMGLMVLISLLLFSRIDSHSAQTPEHENPAQIKTAILFGMLYSLILLLVAAAEAYFGVHGVYAVAVLSGLTDMDAITLSTSEMVELGRMEPDTGWRVILLASMSNLVFKWGAVAVFGSRTLLVRMSMLSGLLLAAGALVLAVWQ